MPDVNPYQPSSSSNEQVVHSFRLRLVPAVILGIIGLAALAWGLFALVVLASIVFRDYDTTDPLQAGDLALMLTATAIFLSVGFLAITSAWHLWKQNFRHAMAYIAIVLVLIAIAVTMSTIW